VPGSQDYQPVKSELYFRYVNITFKEGTVLKCNILGLKEDTIIVSVKKNIQKISISAVSKIGIDDKNITGWTIGGFYIGQVLFFSLIGLEDPAPPYRIQPDIAIVERGFLSLLTMGVVLGAGGLIHLIEGDESFYFTGSDEEVSSETEKLKEFLLVDKPVRNKFQLSVECAFVNTTYSRIKNTLDHGDDGLTPFFTNFNMMRKIQAVYSVSSNFDVGAAYVITGEPSFYWQRYVPGKDEIDLLGISNIPVMEFILSLSITLQIHSHPFSLILWWVEDRELQRSAITVQEFLGKI